MAGIVKVYGMPRSTCTLRVLAALSEKDVDFELVFVNLMKGEHKQPPFLALQVALPLHTISPIHTNSSVIEPPPRLHTHTHTVTHAFAHAHTHERACLCTHAQKRIFFFFFFCSPLELFLSCKMEISPFSVSMCVHFECL